MPSAMKTPKTAPLERSHTAPLAAGPSAADVDRYMPLVRRLARRYHQRSGVELDDLVQVASMGLLRAMRRYQPEKGYLFEAFASSTISGEILHYLRDSVPLIRPPRELVELRPAVKSATSKLTQQASREPSCDEIAKETGLCPHKVAEIIELDRVSRPESLDADLEQDDDGSTMRLQLTDQKYRSFQLATEDRIMLMQALIQLKPQALEVIDYFFFQDLSQQSIADRLGISQTQVSRRIRMAVRELLSLLNLREPVDEPQV